MQRNVKLLELLRSADVEVFVNMNKNSRIDDLALRFRGKVNFPLAPVIEWIDALQRAEKKLPFHASKTCYLTKRALEQASSEHTALYKASLADGLHLLNLCGGLGIDDWAFAGRFQKIVSLETDENLHELALANLAKLDMSSIERLHTSAEHFLEEDSSRFDWIYADPDRREAGKRLVGLADCSPDLTKLWPLIREKSDFQMVKLSPLYPLEQLEKELPGIFRIEVVSLHNEVKEVLAICGKTELLGPPVRRAVSISSEGTYVFDGQPASALTAKPGQCNYFYEAHPALAKANLATTYALEVGSEILIPNGIFQQSDQLISDYFGRTFRKMHGDHYSRKQFQRYLKLKGISKANFTCRYFRQTPEALKKIFGLVDGGDDYFFFFEDGKKQPYYIHGRKLADYD